VKKVLIITYYWPPSGGAGVQRWLKFAKYLPQFGWEPVVLTVAPENASYPQIDKSLLKEAEGIETIRTKTFELYSIYSSLKKDKQIPYGGFSNESKPSLLQKAARFVRGNFFLPDSRKGWNKFAFNEAKKLIDRYGIEYIVTTSPPHSTQLIGLKLKKEFGLKWLADLRDPWTDIYYYDKFYPTKIARNIDAAYEAKVLQNADIITTVSPSIRRKLNEKYEVGSRLQLLTNGFDEMDFSDTDSACIRKNEILYTGTITMDYPVDEVISMAMKLSDYTFRFIGNVPDSFVEQIQNSPLNGQFVFESAKPHSEIVKLMQTAEYLLLLIPKIKDSEGILTGKLFEYLGARRPVVAIGPRGGDVQSILTETGSGAYYDYEAIKSIDKTIILSKARYSGGDAYKAYSRRSLTRELSNLLASL
jgi:hypothetical protein